MKFNSEELKTIIKCEIQGDFTVDSFVIDSRKIVFGSMFIALAGSKDDGHNYIDQAIAKGVGALLVNKEFAQKNNINFANLVIVEDTFTALIDMAYHVRSQFQGEVIGVTGSIGKTTLKEMLYHALKDVTKVYISVGNFNTQFGLPLSLLNMDITCQVGVFELGMRGKGEISFLAKILRPHLSIITDVSSSHMAYFSSLTQIADAKLEILDGMISNSYIFINKDNECYSYIVDKLKHHSYITFSGFDYSADIRTDHLYFEMPIVGDFYYIINACLKEKNIKYRLKSLTPHNVMLANLALGVVDHLGFNIKQSAKSLGDFLPIKGRGRLFALEIDVLEKKSLPILLIDDSYNASFQSVIGSLQALDKFVGYRKVIILCDLLDLGDQSDAIHTLLIDYLINARPDELITVGNYTKIIYEKLKVNTLANHFDCWQHSIGYLYNSLSSDRNVVLVKGSNVSGSVQIADAFIANQIVQGDTC